MEYKFSKLFSWTSGKPILANEHGTIPIYGSNGIIGYTDNSKYFNKIILGRVGAYCGSVEYCPTEFNATDNTLITTCNEKLITYPFAFYSLKLMKLNNFAGGSAQPLITQGLLKHLKCDVPSIEKQKIIADIFSTYDNLIENNNKRIKLLEQMAENLYKEWFVRFRFPGYENVGVVEKKPRGWQVGTDNENHYAPTIFKYDEFRNIGSFIRGKNITATNMIEGEIPVISAGIQPSGYHNEANVFGTSITISASGANAGYLQYHLNDIWAADCSYYQDKETIWFVYNALKYLQPVISNLQCGAAQPHVYPKNINRLCILIPTIDLMKKYIEFVSPYYEEIRLLNKSNISLIKQRNYLLPRLMSGKLKV